MKIFTVFMSLQQYYINGLLAGSLMLGVCPVISAEETSAVGALPEYFSEEQEGPAHMAFMAEHVRKLLALQCFASQKRQGSYMNTSRVCLPRCGAY